MAGPRVRQTAFVYIGTLLGAGFASGQELSLFFGAYGTWGLIGILAAGMLLGLGGYRVSRRSLVTGAKSFSELLNTVPAPLGAGIRWMQAFFLFAGLAIMLSAGGSLGQDQLNLHRAVGVVIMAAATLFFCWWNTASMLRISDVVVPVLLSMLLIMSLLALAGGHWSPPSSPGHEAWGVCGWWLAAVLYVGYNMLGGSAVLPPLSCLGADTARGALLGGITYGAAAFICVMALQTGAGESDLPFLTIAKSLGPIWGWVYCVSLALAALSTAAADLFSLAQGGRCYRRRLLIITVLSLPLAFLPFPILVAHLYPAFGYLGLLLLAVIWLPVSRPG